MPDIGETNDLAAQHPEFVKELEQLWRQWKAGMAQPDVQRRR